MRFDWNEFIAKGGALKAVAAIAALGGIFLIARMVIRKNRKQEGNSNGTNNPNDWVKKNSGFDVNAKNEVQTGKSTGGSFDPGVYISVPFDTSLFTLLASNGRLNDLGLQSMQSLDNELWASFYTNDDVVLQAIKTAKTQGDWTAFTNYWNEVIMPTNHKDKGNVGLEAKMASEMNNNKYTEAMDYINKLPLNV